MIDIITVKTALDAIKLVTGAVKSLKTVLGKTEDRDRRLQDDVTRAIRALYFTPTGILSLLHEVARGEKLPEQRIRRALSDFNDREWQIADALQRIDFLQLHHEFGLSLQTIRALQTLRYGKIGLRQQVQREVNFYGQSDVKPNKAAALRLISAIEALNAQIEAIDGVVNTRARTGPQRKTRPAKKAAPRKAAKPAAKCSRKAAAKRA